MRIVLSHAEAERMARELNQFVAGVTDKQFVFDLVLDGDSGEQPEAIHPWEEKVTSEFLGIIAQEICIHLEKKRRVWLCTTIRVDLTTETQALVSYIGYGHMALINEYMNRLITVCREKVDWIKASQPNIIWYMDSDKRVFWEISPKDAGSNFCI